MAGQGKDMKQGVYRTPANFMAAIRPEFPIVFDLAADADNAQAPEYFTENDDALSIDWERHAPDGWLWLNPPYNDIKKWVMKCHVASLRGCRILCLVPAAVGSEWYADWVHGKAEVRFLRPRLVFEFTYPEDYKDSKGNPSPKAGLPNNDPYPKDLMLLVYDADRPAAEFPWDWRKGAPFPLPPRLPLWKRILNGWP